LYKQNHGFAVEEIDHLDPAVFKRMFGVDRETFDEILGKVTSSHYSSG
jgi:hypothetical protein